MVDEIRTKSPNQFLSDSARVVHAFTIYMTERRVFILLQPGVTKAITRSY